MRTTTLLLLVIALPALADPFDHQWCRYSTDRFDIISDLGERQVLRLAEQMAVFRHSVQPFIHGARHYDELSLKVVIFADAEDFKAAFSMPHFTGFMQPSMRQNLLVIGPGPENKWLTENALHEYTHYLLRNRLDLRIPVWYDEGLASLLSTADIRRRDITLGKAPRRLMREAVRGGDMNLQGVLDTNVLFDLTLTQLNDVYLTSWALLHYLSFGTHQTKELEAALRSPDTNLNDALDLAVDELESQLGKYVNGRLPRIRLPKPALEPLAVEQTCLSELERDTELASVMLRSGDNRALDVLQALHNGHPDNVEVLLNLAAAHGLQDDPIAGLQFAERALALEPENADAKIQVGLQLAQTCMFSRVRGCNRKWRRAAELLESGLEGAPERFDAELGLGLAYLHRNRPQDAVSHLRRAYERAPWAPHINLYLGECYRLLDDPRAKNLLTNARNWSTRDVMKRLARSALEQLSEKPPEAAASARRPSEADG